MNNVVNVIYPYYKKRHWVFDDETTGLKAEPFVFGMSRIIDKVLKELGLKSRDKFKLIFSTEPLPEFHAVLEYTGDSVQAGAWYRLLNSDMEGWLCPATLKYFGAYPKKIYVYVERLD